MQPPHAVDFGPRPAGVPVDQALVVAAHDLAFVGQDTAADGMIEAGEVARRDDGGFGLRSLKIRVLFHQREWKELVEHRVDFHKGVSFWRVKALDYFEKPVAESWSESELPRAGRFVGENAEDKPV